MHDVINTLLVEDVAHRKWVKLLGNAHRHSSSHVFVHETTDYSRESSLLHVPPAT